MMDAVKELRSIIRKREEGGAGGGLIQSNRKCPIGICIVYGGWITFDVFMYACQKPPEIEG